MGKVFGYPEFSDDGEMILTTYENDYKAMMMDIRGLPDESRREENLLQRR